MLPGAPSGFSAQSTGGADVSRSGTESKMSVKSLRSAVTASPSGVGTNTPFSSASPSDFFSAEKRMSSIPHVADTQYTAPFPTTFFVATIPFFPSLNSASASASAPGCRPDATQVRATPQGNIFSCPASRAPRADLPPP